MPTKIAWAEETWNPITGCTPISAGCQNCYARKMARRLRGRCGYPADDPFRVTFHPDRLNQPSRWRKPRRIFVCSMGDFWHPSVRGEWQADVLETAVTSPQHAYLFLTKRPERIGSVWRPAPNWWVGTSAENQPTADERIPYLLRCQAAVRFVSLEPCLSTIDIRPYLGDLPRELSDNIGHRQGQAPISWLICGAESNGSRPGRECKLEWIESAVEQAKAAGVPCFVKQIHLDGKLVKDVSQFPKHLQVQEYPG